MVNVWSMTKKSFCFKNPFFIALNMYIGTNVLVYERWLVLKVRYTASLPNAFAIP